jgi:hypothetical protein
MSVMLRGLVLAGLVGTFAACGSGSAASALAQPPTFQPGGAATCGTSTANWRPLLVEWSAPDRAVLEARIAEGVVAVSVNGCAIEILPSCKGPSRYVYTATTPKRDTLLIRNSDELQATIPFGAARFGASLARSGELSVRMNVVGVYAAEQAAAKAEDMKGACDSATHIVTGLAAGAFEFSAGADAVVTGSASVAGLGADGKSTAKHEVLNRDGNDASCAAGRTSDAKPPEGCGAVLRLSLAPIACFEGMHYVEGKGCRKPPAEAARDPSARRYLTEGVAERLELLETQLKDIREGSPVWAKRVEELQREWRRASMKAKFESLALRKQVLEQGTPASPAQQSVLASFDQLTQKGEAMATKYEHVLAP